MRACLACLFKYIHVFKYSSIQEWVNPVLCMDQKFHPSHTTGDEISQISMKFH